MKIIGYVTGSTKDRFFTSIKDHRVHYYVDMPLEGICINQKNNLYSESVALHYLLNNDLFEPNICVGLEHYRTFLVEPGEYVPISTMSIAKYLESYDLICSSITHPYINYVDSILTTALVDFLETYRNDNPEYREIINYVLDKDNYHIPHTFHPATIFYAKSEVAKKFTEFMIPILEGYERYLMTACAEGKELTGDTAKEEDEDKVSIKPRRLGYVGEFLFDLWLKFQMKENTFKIFDKLEIVKWSRNLLDLDYLFYPSNPPLPKSYITLDVNYRHKSLTCIDNDSDIDVTHDNVKILSVGSKNDLFAYEEFISSRSNLREKFIVDQSEPDEDEGVKHIKALNPYLSETVALYYISKFLSEKYEIVGLEHYRTYFTKDHFIDPLDEEDVKSVLNKYDIVCATRKFPIWLKFRHGAMWLTPLDEIVMHIGRPALDMWIDVWKKIGARSPDLEGFHNYLYTSLKEGGYLICCNAFVAHRDVIRTWTNLILPIALNFLDKCPKDFLKLNRRCIAYLIEYTFGPWLEWNGYNIKYQPLRKMGRKLNMIEGYFFPIE